MNPTTNTGPLDDATTDDATTDDATDELHRAVGLVEDWLLHASDETLDELADFAYGPTRRGPDQLRWIIDRLGEAAARLRPAPAAPESTTADPEPSR
jgi:hypothetical protein